MKKPTRLTRPNCDKPRSLRPGSSIQQVFSCFSYSQVKEKMLQLQGHAPSMHLKTTPRPRGFFAWLGALYSRFVRFANLLIVFVLFATCVSSIPGFLRHGGWKRSCKLLLTMNSLYIFQSILTPHEFTEVCNVGAESYVSSKKSNLHRLLWSSGAVVLLSPWSFVSIFFQKISKEGTRTPRRSSSALVQWK